MICCHACNRRLAVCSGHLTELTEGRLGKRVGFTALAGSNPASSACDVARHTGHLEPSARLCWGVANASGLVVDGWVALPS
jgi:hypothetical protein